MIVTDRFPLRTISQILDVDATFVSLQKDPRPNDAAVLRERNDMMDLTADLADFTETAALVSCLDLVITVDTSVAHLAGALGRPTWILLPYRPDYRWLLDRDDSPWYPSVRLFRQNQTREYESVLERLLDELRARIVASGPRKDLFGQGHRRRRPQKSAIKESAALSVLIHRLALFDERRHAFGAVFQRKCRVE